MHDDDSRLSLSDTNPEEESSFFYSNFVEGLKGSRFRVLGACAAAAMVKLYLPVVRSITRISALLNSCKIQV